MSREWNIIFKKEVFSFFEGVQAWVVLAVYILISMFLTFFGGGFFSINNAGLFSFFYFQPYIMAFLIPAVTMRLWAEERKNGTLEFLLTQPISLFSIIFGKFLAAWFMCVCMLFLSTPLWIYMNVYFQTDNLNIVAGYIAVLMVSGSFCALCCLISTFCSSPAVSYLWGVMVLLFVNVYDFSKLIKIINMPISAESKLSNMLNLNNHYYDLITGQISLDNILFFVLSVLICLLLNFAVVDFKKN